MPNQPVPLHQSSEYRGRFAPTPSGPLHFGSLVAALGSYLDAKAHQGKWLVRIEDVDKPRAVAKADSVILQQLEQHGLCWDESVIYQSQRDQRYRLVLQQLGTELYHCDCSRQQIRARGDCYDGYCRDRQPRSTPYAVRFKNDDPVTRLDDRWHGLVDASSDCVREDFIVRRRDELFAYQLAVVVDDIDQGITDIVRGSDLLQPSFWQLTLWQRLSGRQPRLMHLPLVTDAEGRKLSKQNHAAPIDSANALENLKKAATVLGLGEIAADNIDDFIKKAIIAWSKQWRIGAN
ncbi:tRNA glutamyl-Q(34) synthetase GluQRS [Idiomarina sp. OT37-5b]|uniref:tRNA glutamyl-Q(34) synthetase GluQRS n=1 Tax=Idiomarina sp. OT37-5b TaxID=2100422 RepID=UPI0021CB235B|nr:tRNA glutamyl-Q(34) synthetase GluQRS [Idiomarina sp. OT37-5b]